MTYAEEFSSRARFKAGQPSPEASALAQAKADALPPSKHLETDLRRVGQWSDEQIAPVVEEHQRRHPDSPES